VRIRTVVKITLLKQEVFEEYRPYQPLLHFNSKNVVCFEIIGHTKVDLEEMAQRRECSVVRVKT